MTRTRSVITARVAAWRHAWSEAAYRVAGTWYELVDWLRSGG